METQAYYAEHRELDGRRKRRPSTLDANRARGHPIVDAKTQAKWLAQLKRLDDPHTVDLALAYIDKHIVSDLKSPQIPSFLALFSQSTDSATRRQCARIGCVRVFMSACRSLPTSDLQSHAKRIASAICLYAGDPDEAVRHICGQAVATLVGRTTMAVLPISAPFLALLRTTQRWQAQGGACDCLREAIDEAVSNIEEENENESNIASQVSKVGRSVDAIGLRKAVKNILGVSQTALKRVHPRSKPGLYAVIISCIRAAVCLSGAIESTQLSVLLGSIANDIRGSSANEYGRGKWDGVWRSRQAAAVALGEILTSLKEPNLDDCENARHALEHILFDKVPGVRSAAQAVLSLRVLGGREEKVPEFDSSGAQAHAYGRVRKQKGGDIFKEGGNMKSRRGRIDRSKPAFAGRRRRKSSRSPSPERLVAESTVDMALQQAFERIPEGLPKTVKKVEAKPRKASTENPEEPTRHQNKRIDSDMPGVKMPTNGRYSKRRPTNINPHRAQAQESETCSSEASTLSSSVSGRGSSSSTGDRPASPSTSSPSGRSSDSSDVKNQIAALLRQQAAFSRDLSSIRGEVQIAVSTMSKQMRKLEQMILGIAAPGSILHGNAITDRIGDSQASKSSRPNASPWMSRSRKNIERARDHAGHRMGTGHAQLVLETSLASGDDDGGLMRQCNATGPSCLKTLSLATQKRLFVRLLGMVERNHFVLQALPWFQTAMHMNLLSRVLSSPGAFSRAVQCFQSLARSGGSSALAMDAHVIFTHLTSNNR